MTNPSPPPSSLDANARSSSDPKHPSSSDPKHPSSSDPKHPSSSDPKHPSSSGLTRGSRKLKKGLLLINLGTPDAPTTASVRRFLRQFLSDPRVIDVPALVRAALLYGVILPTRPQKSAKAYQQIWTAAGSPLRVHAESLQLTLQERLGNKAAVAFGMRYGNPSIESAIDHLLEQQCDTLHVLPLFPQYASATTGSALEEVFRVLSKKNNVPIVHTFPSFYAHPSFIRASAALIEENLKDVPVDLVLMSYHGLTERSIKKTGCAYFNACQKPNPCPELTHANAYCYRAQCFATSRAIAQALEWSSDFYRTCFQSRLGRTPWIQPYTDKLLNELAEQGVKNLAIACPAFVADCLETLEEIGIRGRKQWQQLGGEHFTLVPCLNAHLLWVDALEEIITD